MKTAPAKLKVPAAGAPRRGPLWALVERWEGRRDEARAAARDPRFYPLGASAVAASARAGALDSVAAELADVLRTFEGGEA